MQNDDYKTQLLQLLLDQWKTDRYVPLLQGRFVYYVLGETCHRLTNHDGNSEDVFSTDALSSSQEVTDMNCTSLYARKRHRT